MKIDATAPRTDIWRRAVATIVLGAVLLAVGAATDHPEVGPLALALIPAALVRAAMQAAGLLRSGTAPRAVLMDTLALMALVLLFAQVIERIGWGIR